jgi:hypothetical protein
MNKIYWDLTKQWERQKNNVSFSVEVFGHIGFGELLMATDRPSTAFPYPRPHL